MGDNIRLFILYMMIPLIFSQVRGMGAVISLDDEKTGNMHGTIVRNFVE